MSAALAFRILSLQFRVIFHLLNFCAALVYCEGKLRIARVLKFISMGIEWEINLCFVGQINECLLHGFDTLDEMNIRMFYFILHGLGVFYFTML